MSRCRRNDPRPPPHDATTKTPDVTTTRTKRPQQAERRANRTGDTKDGQERVKRGQTAGRTRYARVFSFFISDYLTLSIPLPSPPVQNTKNTKNAPVRARSRVRDHTHLPQHGTHRKRAQTGAFFVSGTTSTYPTSHHTKHMKNTPKWARFLCLGPPPTFPTSHSLPNT